MSPPDANVCGPQETTPTELVQDETELTQNDAASIQNGPEPFQDETELETVATVVAAQTRSGT